MKLVVYTQYLENYGAHAWDGEGECPQYWKSKGGDTYVVNDLSPMQILAFRERGIISQLYELLEYSNDYAREYILAWDFLDNDKPVCTDWETPYELSFEDCNWVVRRTIINDEYGYMPRRILSMTQQFIMLPGRKRKDYIATYDLRSGEKNLTEEQVNAINYVKQDVVF